MLHAHINDLKNVVVSRKLHCTNVDLDVVSKEILSKLPHFFGPCSTPHEGLPVRSDLLND